MKNNTNTANNCSSRQSQKITKPTLTWQITGNMQPVLTSDPLDFVPACAGENHKWWLNTDTATPLQNEAA